MPREGRGAKENAMWRPWKKEYCISCCGSPEGEGRMINKLLSNPKYDSSLKAGRTACGRAAHCNGHGPERAMAHARTCMYVCTCMPRHTATHAHACAHHCMLRALCSHHDAAENIRRVPKTLKPQNTYLSSVNCPMTTSW